MTTMRNVKTYGYLKTISDYYKRFEYLKLDGCVGQETFASQRYLNQILYGSKEWKDVRRKVIIRDDGCDMAHPDFPIYGRVYIHHITPLRVEDILDRNDLVFDIDNLVCVSFDTHNAIHYGTVENLPSMPTIRSPNDTCPWKE